MLIDDVATLKEFHEVVVTDVNGDGETNRGPERVASPNPVPKLKHVLGIDAECADGFGIG